MVPHLITAHSGPINELEQRVLDSMPAIERWFRLEWMEHTPPFYCSVDLRNAGYKLAPVDTNLFPTGWNHLTPEMLPQAVQSAMAAIEKVCPEAKNLLIVPQSKPGDSFYLGSVAQLARIFHRAGLNVRIGSIDPNIKALTTVALPTGETVTLEPVERSGGRIGVAGFDPCTVLLNTDLSAGPPGILEDLHEQILLPPLHAGQSVRRMSTYFESYEELAKRLGKLLGFDPWLINPLFNQCGAVDLGAGSGMECLSSNVEALLTKIKRKYKDYGIHDRPYVVVKADRGAKGQGLITVRDAKELSALSASAAARQRANAASAKPAPAGNQDVIIQEGVLTNERVNAAVAEPVVYMMDRYVVGGFYRVHAAARADEDLSAPGSSFVPLAFAEAAHLPQPGVRPGVSAPNRFYMYGVVARLSLLAAAYELEATDPQAHNFD